VLLLDGIVAVIDRFGWQIGGAILVFGGLVTAVRILAVRLEKAYLDQVVSLKEVHATQMKDIRESCAREVAEVRAYGDRGWAMADQFRAQSER
jgi:hypothetical protein